MYVIHYNSYGWLNLSETRKVTYNMSEKFCLKWNDFHANVSNSFGLLRNEDYLHDITIVTDDNEQVAAHKLVLSACGEYFKNIFKRNKNLNLLLCIEGVNSAEFGNILDYIYNGEVQISQENLDRFLEVAQRFQLEGLLGNKQEDSHHDFQEQIPEDEMKGQQKAKQNVKSLQKQETNERAIVRKIVNSGEILEVDQRI